MLTTNAIHPVRSTLSNRKGDTMSHAIDDTLSPGNENVVKGRAGRSHRRLATRLLLRAALVSAVLVSALGMGCAAPESEEPETQQSNVSPLAAGTKWHPGHYVYVGDRKVLKDDYIPSPVFRGVQKNYFWSDLEPTKGHYDFSEIDKDIEFLRDRGLYLAAQITYKTFKPGTTGVPAYIVNGAELGPDRTYVTDNGSTYPSIWVPAVEQRFRALLAALGKRYDKDSTVELINLPETANGAKLPVLLAAGYTNEKDEAAHKRIMLALRDAFPHTVRIQYMNWSKTLVQHLTDYAKQIGVGVGGPDFNPNRDLPTNEACLSARGVVPLASAVQYADYFKNPPNAGSGLMDPHLIYDYGRDDLHLNYIFWAKDPAAGFDAAADMLDEPSFPKNASGGLENKAPTKLGP